MLNVNETQTLNLNDAQYTIKPQAKTINNAQEQVKHNAIKQEVTHQKTLDRQIVNQIRDTNIKIQANEVQINDLEALKEVVKAAIQTQTKEPNKDNDEIIKQAINKLKIAQDNSVDAQQKEIIKDTINKVSQMYDGINKEKIIQDIHQELKANVDKLTYLSNIQIDDDFKNNLIKIDKITQDLKTDNLNLKNKIELIKQDNKEQEYNNDEVSKLELKDVFNASLDKDFFKSVQNLLDPMHG